MFIEIKDSAGSREFEELLSRVQGGEKLKTCIQCGSCSATCPGTGKNLYTHREFWRLIQLGDAQRASESQNFWNCTNCELCEKRCPRGVPLGKIIMALREDYTTKKGAPANMAAVAGQLSKQRNISGDPAENRLLWCKNMGGEKQGVLDAMIKEKANVLYYTGCVSSLFPQAYSIPQAMSLLLIKSGVNFSFLGSEEWCCGYPLLGAGYGEEVLREYAKHLLEIVQKKSAKTLLLSCPTCTYAIKHSHRKLVPELNNIEILHYTEYLPQLVREGKLNFNQRETVVTYHDPCDLGRKSGITEPPRDLIKLSGAKLVEMRFNRTEGKCCGGGGNLEMQNAELADEIAALRVSEALETGASALITTCQQCKRTLQGGARKLRARIKVYDLLEFLAEQLNEGDIK